MSHTPLPWRIFIDKDHPELRLLVFIAQLDGDDRLIALMQGDEQGNTEFIVRACNSHDDLLAALEGLGQEDADGIWHLDSCEAIYAGGPRPKTRVGLDSPFKADSYINAVCEQECIDARAAIAKAKLPA